MAGCPPTLANARPVKFQLPVNQDIDDCIVLHLIDGQRGDNDLSANGVIVDPGLPAV